MITALKKNKFTQTLARGAAALGVLAGVGVVSVPAQATVLTTSCALTNVSCTLTELINGGTIQVGDKLFDEWGIGTGVNGTDLPAPTNVNPDNIVVGGIDQDTLQPGPGLIYTFSNNELSLNTSGTKQIWFNYRVKVTDPNFSITDNLLRFTVGQITGVNTSAEVHEFVYEDAARNVEAWGTNIIGTTTNEKDVYHFHEDNALPPDESVIQDGIKFSKLYKELYITKEFSVDVSGPTGTVSITDVKQNFSQITSQTVPESSGVLGLLALGGLGLGIKSIKRKQQG